MNAGVIVIASLLVSGTFGFFQHIQIALQIIMKTANRVVSVLSAILLASLLGCAATATQQATGEYVDDAVTTAKVKAAIFDDPTLKSAEINVETFKGVVQLSGFVNSKGDINQAIQVTRAVPGVVSVKNDMRPK